MTPLQNLSTMQRLVSPATIPVNPSQIATFSSNGSYQVHLRGLSECFRKLYAHRRVPIAYPFSPIQVTLADQQADPNSPLFSAKTFEELGL